MLIYWSNIEDFIRVEILNTELNEGRSVGGGWIRRVYGVPQSLTYTFEKREDELILAVEFGRYKDPGFLSKITLGQHVKEALMLWKLAHMPGAMISGHEGRLMDGRALDLIKTVIFRLDEIDVGR